MVLLSCGCSQDSRQARRDPVLGPGAFRLAELATSGKQARYLASAGEGPTPCAFELWIDTPKPAGAGPFSISAATLVRRPGADCTAFLRQLSTVLAFSGALPKPETVDRLAGTMAILATNQSRAAGSGGGFTSSPPGHWIASKLFLDDGEGEVFLNLNPHDGVGEFSIKDEDYATEVVTALARVLLPRTG
jgi:hypothetical protein